MAQADAPSQETPYLLISCDTHAGPSLEGVLRDYCPTEFLDEFDSYVKVQRDALGPELYFGDEAKYELTLHCPAHDDPAARLSDMDASGVVGAIIFAGGQNHQAVPFYDGRPTGGAETQLASLGLGMGSADVRARELRSVGDHIWNEWLSDYVSASPARLFGVMQTVLWDVDNAVKEIARFHDRGLRVLNLPSPRSDFPPYNDPCYEPIWRICTERGIVLASHSGGGERAMGWYGPGGMAITFSESHWLGRRHLPQMIFGGVFERHPGLKVVFTEQRVEWVPYTLKEYDSIYYSDMADPRWKEPWPRLPSEYFREHCYVGGSFLAPFEVAIRDAVGIENLLWGDDYPHVEGTWPLTDLCLRDTFAEVPEADARKILGENALDVYGFDREALLPIAARIGPLPSEMIRPIEPSDIPEHRSLLFRRWGPWS
jgi:predicted TIM-barrel fold metal-dependent hydrolase